MPLALKVKKSAGVPVTAAVHRLLTAANAARARSDWPSAARHYGSALEQDPDLAHIWIQLGHALKEGGDLAAAEAAYRRAERLQPTNADPLLHLGHVSKLRGDMAGAARGYLAAARLAPNEPAAVGELHQLIANGQNVPADSIAELLAEGDQASASWFPQPLEDAAEATQRAIRDLVAALGRAGSAPETLARAASAADLLAEVSRAASGSSKSRETGPALIFDISDLLTYFRKVRSPTGIQRVQIETIAGALRTSGAPVRICCFLEQRDEWIEIPPPLFLKLCRLSLGDADGEDGEWNAALTRILLLLSTARPLVFSPGAFLINLGTSWWQQNYFLSIRQIKLAHGVRYVPFVHDLIPVLRGEFCPTALTQDFISWAIGVFEHADFFFVNSQSTQRDLIRVGAFLGREIGAEAICVVPLDADNRKPDTPAARDKPLRRWGLDGTPFVLFVSTIEPRKNHLRVFEAWIALLKRHGPQRTPKLVCIGHPGWMNDSIYEQLNTQEILRNHVQIVRFVSDADLAEFYRQCLFTLYPSHYEGWGLPVTESLCHGKVPLVAETSSLPEAGGRFALYFNADSTIDLTAALSTLIFDPEARRARERLIAAEFKPRAWGDLARQMADTLAAWDGAEPTPLPAAAPMAHVGAFHSFRRNRETRIWPGMRSGEIYRAGANWWGPDDWGCWTKPGGATLRIGAPDGAALRIYLRLQGLPSTPCPYRITSGAEAVEGELRPHEGKWLAIDIPADEGDHRVLELEIGGLAFEDLRTVTNNSDPRVISVGVEGFFLCRADDVAARGAFLEAVALGNVADLDFNREPGAYVPLV
jgi:glycosyltransferase involved in cell wall biosynthesis/Flp pilus assembly protein TadD